jgi:hypothetical protein
MKRGDSGRGSRDDGDVVRGFALPNKVPDGPHEPGDGLGRRPARIGGQVCEEALVPAVVDAMSEGRIPSWISRAMRSSLAIFSLTASEQASALRSDRKRTEVIPWMDE